ncbi:MAG: MMPL family transporter [Proteobacteria bacterium]|nr:MMPL family transporter [Pseudomonadota bacterium]
MDHFIKIIAYTIIRFRIALLSFCILITLFFLYVLKDIQIRANLSDFAPKDHPFMKVQQKLTDIFGGLNQVSIAVVVKDGDILNYPTLNKVAQITGQIYLLNGINPGRIVSLSARKIKKVTATADGFKVQRLMRDAPEQQSEMDALKQAIIGNPMIYGPVVSRDFKATLITADFWPEIESRTIFKEINRIVEPYRDSNTGIFITGRPILEGWIYQYLPHMGTVFAGTLIAMVIILYAAFRSKRGVILPLCSALMATIWGMGMLVMCGYSLSPTTILVPFLISALEICHSIQFIKRYYEELSKNGKDCRSAAENSLNALFIPAIMSVITDGVGFLSLFFVPLTIIKSMALGGGMGVLSIFFTTIIFIPTVLSLLSPPKRLEVEREERATVLNTLLSSIAALCQRSSLRRAAVIFFCVVGCCGMLGAFKLVVGDNEEGSETLYPHSPYNVADRQINRLFTGSSSYYVFVQGNREEALIDSSALKEMESLQRYLITENEQAGYSLSLADYIKGLNMVMMGGNPQEFKIPDNNGTVAEYLFLYAISGFPGDFDPVVSPNYQYANIKIDFKDHKAETINKVISKTQEWIKTNNRNKEIQFLFGGGEIGTLGAVNDEVKRALVDSIIQVTGMTFLCVILAYGSLAAAVYLIIPLLFGVLITFGIMGFTGITLTIETLPVAALGIGLGVDYGLYVTSRIREEYLLDRENRLDRAILRALVTSGKAVFFTGSTVVVGVFAWAFSIIRLQARFGLLLGLLISLNILGALVLLPVFFRMLPPKFITHRKASGA